MSDIETRQKKLPVLLFIRGEQYFDDVDPDATELTTEGTLELTEEGLLLTYQETALTGMEGTTTTFEVSGPQVILRRVGSVNSQMVFEEGGSTRPCMRPPTGSCRWISRPAPCGTTSASGAACWRSSTPSRSSIR